ncbi:unnamed protein product [Sphagnum tenellum]
METYNLSKGLFVSGSTDDPEASSFASNVLMPCSDASNFKSSSFRAEELSMGHRLGNQFEQDGKYKTKLEQHPVPKESLSLDEQLQRQLSQDRLRLKLVQAYNICATHVRDPGKMKSSNLMNDPAFELVDNFWQGTNPTHVMQQLQQRIAALSSSKCMTPRSMQPFTYDLDHVKSLSHDIAKQKWTASTPRGVLSSPSSCVPVHSTQEPLNVEHDYESLIMMPICSELDEEIDSTFPTIPFLDQLQMSQVASQSSSDPMKMTLRVTDPMKSWRPNLERCDSNSQLKNDFDNHRQQQRLRKPESMFAAEQDPVIEIEALSSEDSTKGVNGFKSGPLRTPHSSPLGTCTDPNPKNVKQQQGEKETSLVWQNTMKTEKGAREGKQNILHMEFDTAVLNYRAKKKPRISTATSFTPMWLNGLQNLTQHKGDTTSMTTDDFIDMQQDIRMKHNTNATTMSNTILQPPSVFDGVKGCEPCAATADNASKPIELEQLLIPETDLSVDNMPLLKLEDIEFDSTGVSLSKAVMDDVPMIEVRMMENKQVMVKLRAKDRPGLFTDMMLALCKLKLQVQHANIRTCVGNRYDIFAAKMDISLSEKQTTQDIAAALSCVIEEDHPVNN